MSLSTGDILYSLDTTTGAANEIGNTGINSNVTSISFYQGQLYACDAQGNLYSVNVINGQATLIATRRSFGVWAHPPSRPCLQSPRRVGACRNRRSGQRTVDPIERRHGCRRHRTVGQHVWWRIPGNTLYQVNLANCALTAIGNGTVTDGYRDFGATTGKLYGIGQDSASGLYSVNPNTGATTFIGPTNLPFNGGQGVSANCPVLYATAQPNADSALYLINTTTGAASEIGDTGVDSDRRIGM